MLNNILLIDIIGIGLQGLTGLDKLMSFRLVYTLRSMLDDFKAGMLNAQKDGLGELEGALYPTHDLPDSGLKAYASPFMKKISKLTGAMLEPILRIGQVQLLRRHIANELYFACKLDSNLLFNALDNVNKSIIKDIREHYRNQSKPYPDLDNPILPEVSKYLDGAGMNDPFAKIYITNADPLDGFAIVLLYLVISNCEKLTWNHNFCTLMAKKAPDGLMSKGGTYPIDGAPLVVGIATVLKQLHVSISRQFFGLLGQYIRCNVKAAFANKTKPATLSVEVLTILLFVDQYCKFTKTSRKEMEYFIPAYLFNAMAL
jgi:WASH complex subunit strumpellin